ncbi:unnamed protein product [Linum trigynum]|uniref:Aminotransferase-like plant mobile domain-containing protein n=1 Tax=Linum trigynum TaxID=586398 RepID=A0AAV2GIT2_9ROSI
MSKDYHEARKRLDKLLSEKGELKAAAAAKMEQMIAELSIAPPVTKPFYEAKKIKEGYTSFKQEKYEKNREHLDKVAKQQSPKRPVSRHASAFDDERYANHLEVDDDESDEVEIDDEFDEDDESDEDEIDDEFDEDDESDEDEIDDDEFDEDDESEGQASHPALYVDSRAAGGSHAHRHQSGPSSTASPEFVVARCEPPDHFRQIYDVDDRTFVTPSKGKKERERSCVLLEEGSGGPMVPTIIPSFRDHVAFRLWTQPEQVRGMIQFYARDWLMGKLRNYRFARQGSEGLVRKTGLFHLPRCMLTHAHLDLPLLAAFVERWQPDTNTFHMPFGEMTILLHDVFYILRIPVDGEMLSGGGHPESLKADMCDLLKVTRQELVAPVVDVASGKMVPLYKSGALLGEAALTRVQGRGDMEAEVQCYLLLLLGSTLFADRNDGCVPAMVNLFLKDYDRVGRYAWGAGTLANLYRQLGMASRADASELCGCLTLLQAWIYQYFPTLRGPRCEPHTLKEGEPYALKWQGVHIVGERAAGERLRYYRRVLDTLNKTEVMWLPYGHNPGKAVPRSLYHGVIRFGDVAEFYDPTRCLRQFGYRQVVPGPPVAPTYAFRPASGIGYTVIFHPSMNQFWGYLTCHMLRLDAISTPVQPLLDVAEEYMGWYTAHSHPYIVNPILSGHHQQPAARTDLLARQILHRLAPLFSARDVDTFKANIHEYWVILEGVRGLWNEYQRLQPRRLPSQSQ